MKEKPEKITVVFTSEYNNNFNLIAAIDAYSDACGVPVNAVRTRFYKHEESDFFPKDVKIPMI